MRNILFPIVGQIMGFSQGLGVYDHILQLLLLGDSNKFEE